MRRWMMTGLGLGFAPVASGTFGSAGAAGVAFLLYLVDRSAGGMPLMDAGLLVGTILATVGCVVWGRWAIDEFARVARKPGDPGPVVLDEFAGQWVALIALPMPSLWWALAVFAAQFFLFRLFDVLKLPPARQLEKLPVGWGIVCDDLAAGVQANLVGQVIFRMLLPI